jgi:hypothetical protein
MPVLITTLYLLIILVFLAFGAAIIFHLLYYKINRKVASAMSLIYAVGAVLLLISNFVLFRQVNWEQILGNFRL